MQKCRRRKVETIDKHEGSVLERRAVQILPLLKQLSHLYERAHTLQGRIVEIATTPNRDADSIDEQIEDLMTEHSYSDAPIDLAAARIVVRGQTKAERAAMIERLERELKEIDERKRNANEAPTGA